ncbi:MAG: hypothetical protein AAGO57_07545 [Pseudomonadota bacterium]
MLLRAAILLLLASTAAAAANPWPRDTEGTFISVTEDFGDLEEDTETRLFIESGAGKTGPSIGVSSVVDSDGDAWTAFAFVRQPLSSSGARDQFALSAGIGAQQTQTGSTEPLVVLGGAWGRGVDGLVNGWLSLEGEARYATDTGETELQGDATIAVSPIDQISLVNELSLTGVPGSDVDADAQLTSSIVGNITDQARIQLGATVDLSGDTATGFRLGTWLEF